LPHPLATLATLSAPLRQEFSAGKAAGKCDLGEWQTVLSQESNVQFYFTACHAPFRHEEAKAEAPKGARPASKWNQAHIININAVHQMELLKRY